MPPQTPGDDELETVQHPTLGTLKFPKSMPQEERQNSIDYVIRQKYGLPEGTDLHAKDPETEAGKTDRNKYTNAYYEANTKVAAPQASTRGYMANLLPNLPSGSPFAWPGYSQAKAAYETGMGMAKGLFAARARGEPLYRQAASTAAPLVGLNEEQVRRAADVGDRPGIWGALTMPMIYAALPFLMPGEKAPGRGRAPVGETLPETRKPLDRYKLGGGGGGAAGAAPPQEFPPGGGGGGGIPPVTPRRPAPSATEALDRATQPFFPGRKFGDLTTEQQALVVRGTGERTTGPRPGEQRVTKGTWEGGLERRAEQIPPGTIPPAGTTMPVEQRKVNVGGPGGVERRSQALEDWQAAQARSAATGQPTAGETLEATMRQGGAGPGITEGEAQNEIKKDPAEWERFIAGDRKTKDSMLIAAKNRLVGARGEPGGLPTTQGVPRVPGAPGAAPAIPGGTPGTIPPAAGTVPKAPAPTTLTPAALPTVPEGRPAGTNVPQGTPMTLDEILRRATGQPEPPKPKPGEPLRDLGGKE